MLSDSRQFPQRHMEVFGPDADSLFTIGLQRLRIERNRELTVVGGADDSIPLDARPEKHDRPN
jgi:hypothetical protein